MIRRKGKQQFPSFGHRLDFILRQKLSSQKLKFLILTAKFQDKGLFAKDGKIREWLGVSEKTSIWRLKKALISDKFLKSENGRLYFNDNLIPPEMAVPNGTNPNRTVLTGIDSKQNSGQFQTDHVAVPNGTADCSVQNSPSINKELTRKDNKDLNTESGNGPTNSSSPKSPTKEVVVSDPLNKKPNISVYREHWINAYWCLFGRGPLIDQAEEAALIRIRAATEDWDQFFIAIRNFLRHIFYNQKSLCFLEKRLAEIINYDDKNPCYTRL